MQSMLYRRLARGLQNQTSELIPVTENINKIIAKDRTKDQYLSLFLYEDKHYAEFKKSRSVAGFKDLKTYKLLFDFDDSKNIENAKRDALTVIDRLIYNGVNDDKIQAFFSGGKGFHLEVSLTEPLNRQEFLNIVGNLAGDLKTFDGKINDENRIIRAPLTKHPKTGLFKIPLTVEELSTMTMEEITSSAIEIPDDFEGYDEQDFKIKLTPKLIELKNKEYKRITVEVETPIIPAGKEFGRDDIDFSLAPKWMSHERYALQQGFFYGASTTGKGERNSAFMILAATYKNQGFTAEHALGLLMATSERQARITGEDPYTEDQMKREVINTVYSSNWKGGQFGKDEELLVVTRQRFGLEETSAKSGLVKIDDVGDRFRSFAKNFEQNRILTGFKSLDDKLVLTTGMAVGLLGAPGSGKTSILNAIIENQSKKDIPCVYQSLDMSDNLLYMRLLQKYTSLPVEKLLNYFKDENPDPAILKAYSEILKNYSKVHFNFRSAMTVSQIDKDIESFKQETGLAPKVIAVDYLEKVRSDYTDPSVSSGMVASQLSDLAKKHEALVLVLLQPQKSAGDASQPLLSMRKVKGASVIEQDLRVILTAWREGFNPQQPHNDRYMSVGVVKNNLGETCQIDFGWHGLTGAITELDAEGKRGLKELRDEIAAQQLESKKDWDI